MKVEPKFQVRPQDDGDARTMGFPLGKSAHRWSGPKRWAVCAPESRAIGIGLPKPVGIHVLPLKSLDSGHGVIEKV